MVGTEPESLSEAFKMRLKPISESQQYDTSSNQNQALKMDDKAHPNFVILSKISEEDKNEILQTGFRLNQEGKISLKKYYEGTGEYSLFESKRYSIKYESIGRTKLYQQLKP
jgi:hypothetical protein